MTLNNKWPFYAFETLETVHPKQNRKKPHQLEQMIFRIVQDHQPNTMLEVGTTTGIETRYMSSACPKAHCISIPHTKGAKEQVLQATLTEIEKLDFALFNAPTERQQRMNDFRLCLQKAHEGSLFVIKHIHQNPEQAFTWKLIRSHPQVRASIDLYSLGILFFKSDLPKCNVRIKL